MDAVFRSLGAYAYLDDIVIPAQTSEEHIAKLRGVLQACRDRGIALKLKKCHFGSAKLDYLGHVVGSGQIVPQDLKLQAVINYPLPQTRRKLKGFLGLTNYYRENIRNYAKLAAPLEQVTGKKSPKQVKWTQNMLDAFNELRQAFASPTLLQAPDMSAGFVLTTDACATGIGAELTQEIGDEVKHLGFFSKRMKKCQKAYSATELEAFAVQAALRHFAPIIMGADVEVRTDHRPLLQIDDMVNDNPKLMRWAQVIQRYHHRIVYKPGKTNTTADALSRSWMDDTEGGDHFKEGEMLCQEPSPEADRPPSQQETENNRI